jgi:hypothetical protein
MPALPPAPLATAANIPNSAILLPVTCSGHCLERGGFRKGVVGRKLRDKALSRGLRREAVCVLRSMRDM